MCLDAPAEAVVQGLEMTLDRLGVSVGFLAPDPEHSVPRYCSRWPEAEGGALNGMLILLGVIAAMFAVAMLGATLTQRHQTRWVVLSTIIVAAIGAAVVAEVTEPTTADGILADRWPRDTIREVAGAIVAGAVIGVFIELWNDEREDQRVARENAARHAEAERRLAETLEPLVKQLARISRGVHNQSLSKRGEPGLLLQQLTNTANDIAVLSEEINKDLSRFASDVVQSGTSAVDVWAAQKPSREECIAQTAVAVADVSKLERYYDLWVKFAHKSPI